MKDRLRLVSHYPGRLRVRAETFRVLPEVAADVVQRLREEAGVTRAEAASLTGSVVIEYRPGEVQLTRIVQLLVRLGGLHGLEVDTATDPDEVPRPGTRVRDALDSWDRAVRRASRGQLDLRVALPGALVVVGVGAFLFGKRRAPEWYDLLLWSFVTFVNLNPTAKDGHPDGDRATS